MKGDQKRVFCSCKYSNGVLEKLALLWPSVFSPRQFKTFLQMLFWNSYKDVGSALAFLISEFEKTKTTKEETRKKEQAFPFR